MNEGTSVVFVSAQATVGLWADCIAQRSQPFGREDRWCFRKHHGVILGSPEFQFQDMDALNKQLEGRDFPMEAPAPDPELAAYLLVERAIRRMPIKLEARYSRGRKRERERRERAIRTWAFAFHHQGIKEIPDSLFWRGVFEALHGQPTMALELLYCEVAKRR